MIGVDIPGNSRTFERQGKMKYTKKISRLIPDMHKGRIMMLDHNNDDM